jgi:hypothetical protein
MPNKSLWSREETLAALHVYLLLPFGQLHQRHPLIKQVASWLGRTPGSVAMKLANIASLDADITSTGRTGLGGASAQDRKIWSEFMDLPALMTQDAARALINLRRETTPLPPLMWSMRFLKSQKAKPEPQRYRSA